MATMHELRGFQRDVLFVLYGLDEPNGQDVLDEMQSSMSEVVQASRIYSNLDDLQEMGLVHETSGNGRANRYALTDAGVDAVRSRHEWERDVLRASEDGRHSR